MFSIIYTHLATFNYHTIQIRVRYSLTPEYVSNDRYYRKRVHLFSHNTMAIPIVHITYDHKI